MFLRFCLLLCASLLCLAQDSPDDPKIRGELGLGVQSYRQGHFAEAARHFEKAVEINPMAVNPHLYLGITYAAQWDPGSQAPQSLELIHKAESEFLKVLEIEPEQLNALESIANLSYQRGMAMQDPADRWEQLTRAAGWYDHLGEASPKRKSAFYMSGMIAWNKCQPEIDAARRQAGMQPDSSDPISNPAVRNAARAKCGEVIGTGIEQLKKGLIADPNYSDAMNYLSILFRQRANLADSPTASKRDIQEAETWAQKAAQAKRRPSKPDEEEQ